MPKPNKGLTIRARRRNGRVSSYEVGKYLSGKWKGRASGLKSFEDAIAEKSRLEKKARAGYLHDVAERLIGDTLADYIAERGPHIKSPNFKQSMKNLIGFWAGRPVCAITEESCEAYYAHRNRQCLKHRGHEISNATVSRELRDLRAAVNRDRDKNRISAAPKVWIRTEINKKRAVPGRADVIRMARNAPAGSALRKYIIIGYYTGARIKFIVGLEGLRWSQVGESHIDFGKGHAQNKKKRPHIKMHPRLRSFMRIWKKRGTDLGYVIHNNQRPVKSIGKQWRTHNRKIGMDYEPYSLRDSLITALLVKNITPYKVAQFTGTSVEMIQSRYGHLIDDHFDDVLDAL